MMVNQKRGSCALGALLLAIQLDKSVYEFSHWFVKEGKLKPYLPTEENNLLQKEVEEFAGDYFKMACDAILKGYDEWKK